MNVNRENEKRAALPSGWRWVKLGEVCRVIGGSTPSTGNPAFWDGQIVWITPTDLGRLKNLRIEASERRITEKGYLSCGTEMLPIGTVVLSSRAPIGYLGIAAIPLCTNQGCKSFIPGENIDSEFLYWCLRFSVSELQRLGSGATFTEISKSVLEAYEIFLPPLAEQKRIAAILNDQMAAIDKARAAAEAQLEAARALPATYLREVFPKEGISLPSGWRCARLRDLVAESLPGFATGERDPSGVIQLRMNNVDTRGNLIWDKFIRVPARAEFISKYKLSSGDVIFDNTNSTELVGKTAFFGGHSESVVYSNHFTRLRTRTEILDAMYLARWLQTLWQKGLFEAICNRWIGQSAIKNDKLLELEIPLPPLAEQKRLVTIVNDQIKSADRICTGLES